MSITNDVKFCFLWVEFQFHTVLSVLTASQTLGELSNTGIKVLRIKCYIYIYLGVISIQIVIDKTRNNVTEGGNVKGKKDGSRRESCGTPSAIIQLSIDLDLQKQQKYGGQRN